MRFSLDVVAEADCTAEVVGCDIIHRSPVYPTGGVDPLVVKLVL